jgi:hypothetical protein
LKEEKKENWRRRRRRFVVPRPRATLVIKMEGFNSLLFLSFMIFD